MGSSPHARGTRASLYWLFDDEGIIPACAGNTFFPDKRAGVHRDHPRMRGEHLLRLIQQVANEGSSPHARGTHMFGIGGNGGKGIIPACAGNTEAYGLFAND